MKKLIIIGSILINSIIYARTVTEVMNDYGAMNGVTMSITGFRPLSELDYDDLETLISLEDKKIELLNEVKGSYGSSGKNVQIANSKKTQAIAMREQYIQHKELYLKRQKEKIEFIESKNKCCKCCQK